MGTNSSGPYDIMRVLRSRSTIDLQTELKRMEEDLTNDPSPAIIILLIEMIRCRRLVLAERIGK